MVKLVVCPCMQAESSAYNIYHTPGRHYPDYKDLIDIIHLLCNVCSQIPPNMTISSGLSKCHDEPPQHM